MRAAAVLLATLAGPATAGAQPLEAGGSACGGNAYSSAQVTEGRGRQRGPLTAVPETLCADVEAPHPTVNIDLYGRPNRGGSASGLGGGRPRAPYDGSTRRRAGPLDD